MFKYKILSLLDFFSPFLSSFIFFYILLFWLIYAVSYFCSQSNKISFFVIFLSLIHHAGLTYSRSSPLVLSRNHPPD